MNILKTIKDAGMRKMLWGLIALLVLAVLSGLSRLDSSAFQNCFIALVGFVMGANYGEHKEKSKPPTPAPTPEVAS